MTLPVKIVDLDLPVRWKNRSVMMPWPTLPMTSWMECIFKKTEGQPILGGLKLSQDKLWKTMFEDFWQKFRDSRGDSHEVFTDHRERLGCCIPCFLHGDEGRGKLHRAVMATSLQPVLVQDGHAGHSFNSRLLHSVMPGELYEGDHSVQILQDGLVDDLQKLYRDGFEVPSLYT